MSERIVRITGVMQQRVEKRKEQQKKLDRKFTRHDRQLLLVDKTFKYLITVPVIGIEGIGIGKVFSGLIA